MKIVVIGGTGLIGSKLITRLTEHGHEGVPAAPNTGVDTLTGEGLPEVLVGADVVVDVSNSPSFADADVLDFFTRSTTNLLAAEKVAGVGHHVALSIVGTDRLPTSGYLRAKVAQEALIRDGGVSWSIVRATQFYEFTHAIAQAATVGDEVRLSTGYFQPMAADDVVAALGPVTAGEPLDAIREIGGPGRVRMSDFVADALAAQGDPRTVVADPTAMYFGAVLSGDELVPGPDAHLYPTTYAEWAVARSAAV
ncbi:SDR family oxidoreductase [Alloalcanivorax gelatiniphagus]